MKGREIADNLRNSKEPWTKNALLRALPDGMREKGNPTCEYKFGFCVVGLKAYEAGVEPEKLYLAGSDVYTKGKNNNIAELFKLNDSSDSKESLIAVLDSPQYAEHDFTVELAIKNLRGFKPFSWARIAGYLAPFWRAKFGEFRLLHELEPAPPKKEPS